MKNYMNNKKVAWVSRSANSIYINILSKLVSNFGWRGLMISQDKRSPENNSNPFKISYLKPISFPFMLFYVPRKIKSYLTGSDGNVQELVALDGLVDELRKYSPDVVVIDLFYLPMTWQAVWYCWRSDTPYIVTIEKLSIKSGLMGIVDRVVIWVSKPIINNASLLTAWTNNSLEFAQKYLSPNGFPETKLLPAGIDTDKFSTKGIDVNTTKALSLVMVARFVPLKRHIDVINALEILHEEGYKDISLTLLGEGDTKNDVMELVKKKGLEQFVTFHEPVPYEEMGKFYKKHDLLILASDKEAIGMVVPEAMARPCVVSDIPENTALIKTGENGLSFRLGYAGDLATRLEQLYDEPKLRDQYGQTARQLIQDSYSLEAAKEKLQKFIAENI
jgi:glycosyltransferase involved in cell wall biosynthesis